MFGTARKKKEDEQLAHPSQETRCIWPDDDLLRRNGFKIERRPRTGEAVWSQDGYLYTQSEALAQCWGNQ